jgi:hypothetical protein
VLASNKSAGSAQRNVPELARTRGIPTPGSTASVAFVRLFVFTTLHCPAARKEGAPYNATANSLFDAFSANTPVIFIS